MTEPLTKEEWRAVTMAMVILKRKLTDHEIVDANLYVPLLTGIGVTMDNLYARVEKLEEYVRRTRNYSTDYHIDGEGFALRDIAAELGIVLPEDVT